MNGTGRGRFGVDQLARIDDGCDNDGLIVNKRFEVLRGGNLWVSVVQHLIKKFVQQDEVLPYGLLGQCAAVILEYFGNFGEKLYGKDWEAARQHTC